MSFELFCRGWDPQQVREVNCVLLTSSWNLDQREPEGPWWWRWLLITSPPTGRMPTSWSRPVLEHYTTPHYPVQGRTHNFEGISLPWPPLPGKTINLFFSASCKTLSPHFYSAQVNRVQVSATSPGIREEPSHMRNVKTEEYFIGKDRERTYLVTVFKCYPHSDVKSLCASKSKWHRGTVIFNVKINL